MLHLSLANNTKSMNVCNKSFNCSYGLSCRYEHPENEKALFRQNNGKGILLNQNTPKKNVVDQQSQIVVGIALSSTKQTVTQPPPLLFTFVCDISGSMYGEKINTVYNEICGFINQQMRDNDLMEMVTFGDRSKKEFGLLEKSQLDLDKIRKQLMSSCNGFTALYDGIGQSLDEMSRNSLYAECQREMIVLTDGGENASRKYKFDDIKKKIANPELKNLHIMIIGVGISDESKLILKELCKVKHAKYLDCQESQAAIQNVFKTARQSIEEHRQELIQVMIQTSYGAQAPSYGAQSLSFCAQPPSYGAQPQAFNALSSQERVSHKVKTPVQAFQPSHQLAIKSKKKCSDSFQCMHGIKCQFEHSSSEKALFEANNGSGIRGYKSKACNGKCHKSAAQCLYAHGRDDSICYDCNGAIGHLNTDRCCPHFKN